MMVAKEECAQVRVEGVVDLHTAREIVLRVRAALQNERRVVELRLAQSTVIRSAEFLGFLAATARHLEERGGRLVIRGAEGKNRNLLEISRLDRVAEVC